MRRRSCGCDRERMCSRARRRRARRDFRRNLRGVGSPGLGRGRRFGSIGWGEAGVIRHLPPELLNPFFVDPQTCYELMDQMLEFCAEFGEDYPNLCDEQSIQALIAGCLAPYR